MENFKNFILSEKFIGPIVILIVGTLFYHFIASIVHKIMSKGKNTYEQKRRKTIINLTTNVIKFFIYSIMVIMILDIYGVDTKSIIASLGIAGVALGLALQESVKDLLSGMYIIMDNYYVMGDIVTINGFTGEVIEMTLKSTKVRNLAGEVLVITNSNITSVVNISQERAGIKLDIPTDYEAEANKVEQVLKNVVDQAKKMNYVYNDSKYLGIESFADSSILYSILIYCKKNEQWDIKRKILKMIKEAYEKENIKIPYLQIEVHNGKKIL